MTTRTSAAPGTYDPAETRARLLDAAERLFADHGFNGVSMRTLTAAAGVNLAAAHYHFRNKEGLYRAVFERRVAPMNAERDRLLDACIAEEARSGKLDPATVLDAFIGPAIRISASPGAENFRRLSGRSSTDPSPEVRAVVYELYDVAAARFVEVLARACPHLTKADLFWRIACIYGAMMYVRADSGRLERLFGRDYRMSDSTAAMKHLVPMLAAGMNLPSLSRTAKAGKAPADKSRSRLSRSRPGTPAAAAARSKARKSKTGRPATRRSKTR